MTQFAPAVIVLEKQPRWAPELRRHLPVALPVRPCRSAAHALSLLRSMPGSLLILDLDQQAAACLQMLGAIGEFRLHCPSVVIGAAPDFELEWPARELGAVAFLANTTGSEALADLCLRQFEHLPATAPPEAPPAQADDADYWERLSSATTTDPRADRWQI